MFKRFTHADDPLRGTPTRDGGAVEPHKRGQCLGHPVGDHGHGAEHRSNLQQWHTHGRLPGPLRTPPRPAQPRARGSSHTSWPLHTFASSYAPPSPSHSSPRIAPPSSPSHSAPPTPSVSLSPAKQTEGKNASWNNRAFDAAAVL
ncbi:hypothetical protein MHYP_G00304740 [Metynnis hypsauchen]